MKKIVAINGFIGSGKDTISNVFIENGFERLSFAGTLKDIVSVLFGWDRDMLEGTTSESRKQREIPDKYWSDKLGLTVTPRWALQHIGTEVFREHFSTEIWIYALERKIMNTNKNIIITDARFKNEIELIKSLGGSIIEVQRTLPDWYTSAKNYNNKLIEKPQVLNDIHPSEYSWVGVNNPDYIIENTGTLEELFSTTSSVLNDILHK